MWRTVLLALLWLLAAGPVAAATLRVPEQHSTIQAALDAAEPGDTVLVAAGTWRERLLLPKGVTVRSAGDNTSGKLGLVRAERTVLDGGQAAGNRPGVILGEGSTLDGFTVTGIGRYDEARWQEHFKTRGENLADEEGSVQATGTVPAISVPGVNATVRHCVVHHNGDVGLAVSGSAERRVTSLIEENWCYRNMGGGIGVAQEATPLVRGNTCFENLRAGIGCRGSSPLITGNSCYGNVRAGIGCREGATPVIRDNRCERNRRAGIGIRMEGTAPVVLQNRCIANGMAGIGCRDGAEPVIRGNVCRENEMAGIGCDGARPLIVGNECRENRMAGIGLRGAATATIRQNRCLENRLVAIGVTGKSTATISDNRLIRTGGVPPLVAVKDGSTAVLSGNELTGGGVATVLVQGQATIRRNRFTGRGGKQGSAVWAWAGSTVVVHGNTFTGYRSALNAKQTRVTASDNTIHHNSGPGILVQDSPRPAHVFGNVMISDAPAAEVVRIDGPAGIVADNEVRRVEAAPAEAE